MLKIRGKRTRLFVRILVIVALTPLIALGSLLLYGTLTDWQPEEVIELPFSKNGTQSLEDTLEFVTWNIGYGAQGKEFDFFYDGGSQVFCEKEAFKGYFRGITDFTRMQKDMDFVLYQEVDTASSRSYHLNEYETLCDLLPEHSANFGMNMNVSFIPIPFTNPLGKAVGGLSSFSHFTPSKVTRYQYPGAHSWPKKLYLLDRCFVAMRFPHKSGKELIVINTHNTAYGNGEMKTLQMNYLKEYLLTEYKKGNYVIVGGDWNQNPPYFDGKSFNIVKDSTSLPGNIEVNYPAAEWQWAYDPLMPTARSLKTPYDIHKSQRTVIDFFLCSPNVEVLKVRAYDQGFAWSDHQPVYLKARLK